MATERNTRLFLGILLAVLFVTGIAVRVIELDMHFVHVDDFGVADTIFSGHDPADPLGSYLRKIYRVPFIWTYAPLQFTVTALLIDPGQEYRQVLFWGRFPSLLFAATALAGMIMLMRKTFGESFAGPAVTAAAVLAFSWEFIIYSRQMESYAIGVAAAVASMLLLLQAMDKRGLSLGRLFLMGAGLAVLATSQYQLWFFFPPFFATLFLYHARRGERLVPLIAKLAVPAALVMLCLVALYSYFLFFKTGLGVNWNAGPAQEFLFSPPADGGIAATGLYALKFFFTNGFIVVQSMTAFLPERHALFFPASVLLFLLFLAGTASLAVSGPGGRKRYLAFYFLGIGVVWAALVAARKITLSPTRHSLILLPIIAFCIAEGVSALAERLGPANWNRRGIASAAAFAVIVAALFFPSFGAVNAERRDKFDEDRLRRYLAYHQVNGVLQYAMNFNVHLMRSIATSIEVQRDFDQPPESRQRMTLLRYSGGAVALVSHRSPPPPEMERLMKDTGFELVSRTAVTSDTEVDFSRRTQNGTNGLFVAVYRHRKAGGS